MKVGDGWRWLVVTYGAWLSWFHGLVWFNYVSLQVLPSLEELICQTETSCSYVFIASIFIPVAATSPVWAGLPAPEMQSRCFRDLYRESVAQFGKLKGFRGTEQIPGELSRQNDPCWLLGVVHAGKLSAFKVIFCSIAVRRKTSIHEQANQATVQWFGESDWQNVLVLLVIDGWPATSCTHAHRSYRYI